LAIKPNDGETFLREVDEELRKEQISNFVARWGWWIIAAVVLILAAVGGWIWWQHHKAEVAAKQASELLEALDASESGGRNAAAKIAALTSSDIEGYRAAALFTRANAELRANNNRAAIATLRSIADDESFDELYRQAALVRQTALEFDSLQPQEVIRRLSPLARTGQPWFGTAGEMIGISYLKLRQADRAGQIFGQIGRDETVPASIRTRAIQMAGSLGVDALPEAAMNQAAAAAPAPQEAAPVPAPAAPQAAPATTPANGE
jgi:hypothetical protein